MGEVFAQLGINGSFLLAQIVNFAILLWLLHRFAYKPLLNMLQTRQARIREGLEAADRARQEAAKEREALERQLEEERRKAQERIAAAAAASEKMKQEILAAAQKEADEIRARAREEAEQEKARILAEVERQIAELSILGAEKVLQRKLEDEEEQRQFIHQVLTQVGELS